MDLEFDMNVESGYQGQQQGYPQAPQDDGTRKQL